MSTTTRPQVSPTGSNANKRVCSFIWPQMAASKVPPTRETKGGQKNLSFALPPFLWALWGAQVAAVSAEALRPRVADSLAQQVEGHSTCTACLVRTPLSERDGGTCPDRSRISSGSLLYRLGSHTFRVQADSKMQVWSGQ